MWIKIGVNFFNLDHIQNIICAGNAVSLNDHHTIYLTEEEVKELEEKLNRLLFNQ